MNRAQCRDSVCQQKFYFRIANEIHLMSINEIINGTNDFSGLVPLIRQYLNDREHIEVETRLIVEQYLSLISKRAAGILSSFFFIFLFIDLIFRNSSDRCIVDSTICYFAF
jgi:hypothetical protein